ncbi:hypothetical protein ASC75_20705 [Aminobacter sp. DSM 101952]|uniref:hypothetical protein n=1 Tax=Aminobacter sp. DSM 101952 TaxID=2735891 RepID=UPI000701AF89|nr:hypothetical protein [Aminobacter sp. DSM 101952]KQU74451.1 hypothetical protein ASC75_20705 [Aminobacter sp. DSM 101952]
MTLAPDETLVSQEFAASPQSAASAINWGPILAGAASAAGITLVLMLLGSGLGLTMVSPWSTEGVTITTLAASTAVWLVIVQWLSAAVGGYLTGRLRTKWVGIHTDETFFRDTAHGFLAWALATLLVAGVLGSVLTAAVGSGVQAASNVASGAAAAVTANAGPQSVDTATSYFVDTLFRPSDPAAAGAAGTVDSDQAALQASRILLASAATNEVSPEDRTYLAQLVAVRTGLSEADARARVDGVLTRVNEAKVTAQQAADTARKASATFALVSALSLAIGAFIASAAGALGGWQRDDDEVRYRSR